MILKRELEHAPMLHRAEDITRANQSGISKPRSIGREICSALCPVLRLTNEPPWLEELSAETELRRVVSGFGTLLLQRFCVLFRRNSNFSRVRLLQLGIDGVRAGHKSRRLRGLGDIGSTEGQRTQRRLSKTCIRKVFKSVLSC